MQRAWVWGALVTVVIAAGGAFAVWRTSAPTGPRFREGPAGEAEPPPPVEITLRPERAYNVLLIVVDTLRADHLGAWGYGRPTSPNIDKLAASGVRFSRSSSQAPWTTPSIGSLMTSRYPVELGFRDERTALPEGVTTLAEHLRTAGLATGAIVSHSFCSDEYNFDQGFESFDDSNVLGHVGASSQGVTDLAVRFLEEHKEKPFFLWTHYFDPHFAYTEHPEHSFPREAPYEGPVESEMRFSELRALPLGPADADELRRLYDSEIAFTDASIGRLLDKLDELGLSDETLVIFTADHGEEFLDHGKIGHSKTLYEELLHVPTIVRCPHWQPGVVDAPVSNIDLFPTALSCLGLPSPDGLRGRPLGPSLPPPAPLIAETARRDGRAMLRDGDLKIVGGRKKGFELYDLSTDPEEKHDLSGSKHPRYDALVDTLVANMTELRAHSTKGARVDPDEQQKAQLEALGYVEE